MTDRRRRSGGDTRSEAQRVALELFTAQGYDATSLREIAERLGITKASLYYHFRSKEDIVRSILDVRTQEARDLLEWVRRNESSPTLLEDAVLRWVGSASVDKLQGVRLISTNPSLLKVVDVDAGAGLGRDLEQVVQLLAGSGSDPGRALMIRAALFSINYAVLVGAGQALSDEALVATSKRIAWAILRDLRAAGG